MDPPPPATQRESGFVLSPVLLNSLLLVSAGVVYHHATGRRYPHAQRVHEPSASARFSAADLAFTALSSPVVAPPGYGVVLPQPEFRLKLEDRERIKTMARRFAPATCLAMPARSRSFERAPSAATRRLAAMVEPSASVTVA